MKNKTALIIIDVQKGFDNPYWGKRNNPQAEKNIAKLLAFWRKKSLPIFHVQHLSRNQKSPLRPGQEGSEIKSETRPLQNEPLFTKQVNSAFIGTDLEMVLKDQHISDVVFVGLTTDHCVSTSIRMADNLGFACTVISNATATFERTGPDGMHYSAEDMHKSALTSLYKEFADVKTTEEIIKNL